MSNDESLWPDLGGKIFVVTGGAKGLGRGIVRALIANGARVAIVGRDLGAANRVAEEENLGRFGASEAIFADVASPVDCDQIIKTVYARFGALDGVVNNAAWFTVAPLIKATPADAARMFDTNTKGPLFLGRAFALNASERGAPGVIVNISSIAGARAAAGCGLYSASKAALDSLTKTMALEWTPLGVRVNGVSPGHIETDGVLADFAAGRLDKSKMLDAIPARRIATPDDVAHAVLFLLSDRARHITGSTLTVDGGEGI